MNLISVHQISIDFWERTLEAAISIKISGEKVIELESLKILRDPFDKCPFFRDEEIEKEFDLHKESELRLMAFYLKSDIPLRGR